MTGQPAADVCIFFMMTLQAEAHFKMFALNSIHAFDLAMAFLAFNLLFKVPLMIKHDMLRNIILFNPGHRSIGIEIIMFLICFRLR